MTLEESLQLKPDYGTQTPLHPIVLQKYRDFVATGKFPYLAQVVDFILIDHPALVPEASALKTQVYFASHIFDEEKEAALAAGLESKGWKRLEEGDIKKAVSLKLKIRLYRRSSSILGNSTQEIVCRPVIDHKGDEFLMPPRARSRGYYARSLMRPFADKGSFIQFV